VTELGPNIENSEVNMAEALFHVSTQKYSAGQIIRIPEGTATNYMQKLMAANNMRGEDLLEDRRPPQAPTRCGTQYAFADLYDCRNYGESQYKGQELYYYRVSMTNPTAAPMALIDVMKQQEATGEELKIMVAQYWNPTEDWEVLEYLSATMKILEEVPAPVSDDMRLHGATYSYQRDIERAKRFCAKIQGE
jgi:hypothetical protein